MSENVLTAVNDELATLLIPMNGKQLVLPNVTVAEIITYVEPLQDQDDVPNWFLGRMDWRGISVPVISFEGINEEPFLSQSGSRRIAVINALIDDQRLPFCGIVAESVPRLMRIQPNEIISDDIDVGPAELAHVIMNGEQAIIPNVDYIQNKILELIA